MRAHFGLPSVSTGEEARRIPISIKFEIPYFTVSGVQVRYLKIVEKSGYQALPWVRYITEAGPDYVLRTVSAPAAAVSAAAVGWGVRLQRQQVRLVLQWALSPAVAVYLALRGQAYKNSLTPDLGRKIVVDHRADVGLVDAVLLELHGCLAGGMLHIRLSVGGEGVAALVLAGAV